MQEMLVQFLGQEAPLEEGMAPHSSILAWRIPWTRESGGLQFMRSQRVRHEWSEWALSAFLGPEERVGNLFIGERGAWLSHRVKTSSSQVQMWGLDQKEGWVKNWCFQIAVLEKTLESPLDYKEIKSVNPKGNQPWICIGRTTAEAEAPVLWPSDVKSRLIGKDPDAGKGWEQEKGMAEDEMVGWHYWLSGHAFEQTPGDGEGQASLVCCGPWGRRESDIIERPKNNNKRRPQASSA